MKRTSIFFRSDLFQPDQSERDYALREECELIFTNSLCRFLSTELTKVGYSVGNGETSQRNIYVENCQQIPIRNDGPFDMWILFGSYLDGRWALVYPERTYLWKRFRRYRTDPAAQTLFETIVGILDGADGISELEFGFTG